MFITILILCVVKLSFEMSKEEFPDDFKNLLKTLGSIAHKRKVAQEALKYEYDFETSPKKAKRRQGLLLNPQKVVLNDVLMMKLVSYYEDKYRISHPDVTMRPTVAEISRANWQKEQLNTHYSKLSQNSLSPLSIRILPKSEDYNEVSEVVAI